jgi:hypothetical protein
MRILKGSGATPLATVGRSPRFQRQFAPVFNAKQSCALKAGSMGQASAMSGATLRDVDPEKHNGAMSERAGQSITLPDDDRIALAQMVEQPMQLVPIPANHPAHRPMPAENLLIRREPCEVVIARSE